MLAAFIIAVILAVVAVPVNCFFVHLADLIHSSSAASVVAIVHPLTSREMIGEHFLLLGVGVGIVSVHLEE